MLVKRHTPRTPDKFYHCLTFRYKYDVWDFYIVDAADIQACGGTGTVGTTTWRSSQLRGHPGTALSEV